SNNPSNQIDQIKVLQILDEAWAYLEKAEKDEREENWNAAGGWYVEARNKAEEVPFFPQSNITDAFIAQGFYLRARTSLGLARIDEQTGREQRVNFGDAVLQSRVLYARFRDELIEVRNPSWRRRKPAFLALSDLSAILYDRVVQAESKPEKAK